MPVKLNYQSYGHGNPVYILHGLFGSHRNWAGIARELSTDYEVIAIDLRNHGGSEHSSTMNYLEMADDILNLAMTMNHEKIRIIGHSMGGKTAMTLALQSPSLIEKLVVVDIAPVQYPTNHDDLISILKSLPVEQLKSRNDADKLLSETIPDASLRAFLLQNLVRSESGFDWRINLNAIQNNRDTLRAFPDSLSNEKFTGPCLFLSGEMSDYIRPEYHDDMTRLFPGSKHSIIGDARHWVHADQPVKVITELQKFLSE